MNYFDRVKYLLESDYDKSIEDYLKNFDPKIIKDFGDKLAQGYKVGIKFNGADSYSDIKATFDLFDPFDKDDVKQYRVTNIKTAKEARKTVKNKELPPEQPKKEDYEYPGDFQEAIRLYKNKMASFNSRKDTSASYDKNGYPKESKNNDYTLKKITSFIDELNKEEMTQSLASCFTSGKQEIIKARSDLIIDTAEKILASLKIFSLGDFTKRPEKEQDQYKFLFTSYENAKKKPLVFKELSDLRKAILMVRKKGSHSSDKINTNLSAITNKEIYGRESGSVDDKGTVNIDANTDSALGDISGVSKLDMNVPTDVAKLKVKVEELFKDMGLFKNNGSSGFKISQPERRYFLGGEIKPEDDVDTVGDISKMKPENSEERSDFGMSFVIMNKMYKWYNGDKTISNDEVKQDVLNIKKNGIATLIALKHRVTAPGADIKKSNTDLGIENKLSNEMDSIKKYLKAKKEEKVIDPMEARKAALKAREERLKGLKK